jgi:hypothetical protein
VEPITCDARQGALDAGGSVKRLGRPG